MPLQLLLHLSVASVQLLLALLKFGLLFSDLLLEDHLHLGLHLSELLFVERTLLLLLDGRVDLLENAGILRDAHSDQLVCPIVLVKVVVGVLLELLHVSANEHLAQLDEVAVFLVVHLDDTPRVATTTDLASISVGDLVGGANNGEGNLGEDLVVLRNGLLIVELIAGTLEDLDLVKLDVRENLHIMSVNAKLQKA